MSGTTHPNFKYSTEKITPNRALKMDHTWMRVSKYQYRKQYKELPGNWYCKLRVRSQKVENSESYSCNIDKFFVLRNWYGCLARRTHNSNSDGGHVLTDVCIVRQCTTRHTSPSKFN